MIFFSVTLSFFVVWLFFCRFFFQIRFYSTSQFKPQFCHCIGWRYVVIREYEKHFQWWLQSWYAFNVIFARICMNCQSENIEKVFCLLPRSRESFSILSPNVYRKLCHFIRIKLFQHEKTYHVYTLGIRERSQEDKRKRERETQSDLYDVATHFKTAESKSKL